MEYDLVYGASRNSFLEKIDEYILEGWLPNGGVAVDNYGFYQSMLRFKNDKEVSD